MSADAGNTIWTPLYWGDYLRDTQDLDLQQHGAYFRLLAHYYTAGPPIPNTPKVWYRICGAMEDEEKAAVEYVATRFFRDDGNGGLIHKRADKEIQRRRERSDAGRKGARARWQQ